MKKKLLLAVTINLFIAGGLGVLILYAARRTAQETPRLPPDRDPAPTVAQLINDVLRPKDGRAALGASQALFGRADQSRLKELKAHPNHGIALRASWEEVFRESKDLPAPAASQDPEKLRRFRQLVEQRLQVTLPDWWGKLLPVTPDDLRGELSRSTAKLIEVQGIYHQVQPRLFVPANMIVEKDGNNIRLQIDQATALIPGALVEGDGVRSRRCDSISAAISPEKVFLALHDQVPNWYPLVCLDRQSGELLWEERVWAGSVLGGGGLVYHYVRVTADDDRVLVFGNAGFAYIDAFDPVDGSCLFRFTTLY